METFVSQWVIKYKNDYTISKFNFTIGCTAQPDRVLYRLGSGCVEDPDMFLLTFTLDGYLLEIKDV